MTTFSCFFLYVFVRGSMCGLCMCGTLMLVFGYMHPCVSTESSEWVIMYPPPLTSRYCLETHWTVSLSLGHDGCPVSSQDLLVQFWGYNYMKLCWTVNICVGVLHRLSYLQNKHSNNWTIEPSYASFLKSSSSVLEYEFIMPDCDSFQWPWPRLP